MPRRIQILPDKLVNQIAAGEVVERPASVVRELVENALDAGCTRLEVVLRNGGKSEIRVADDGWGMGREDALLAFDRHATSKIRSVAELASVRSLGFRGEALPSIASVSRTVLETAESEGEGTRVRVEGGRIVGAEPCARRRGTTVEVRALFFNVPARAKFLRSVAAETRAVSEVFGALAIGHPHVAFRLVSGDRVLIDAPGGASLRSRVGDVWGEALAAELIPTVLRDTAAEMRGVVQRPGDARPGSRRSLLFVNGRVFADRAITRAADRGFESTVPEGVRPAHVLFLDLPEGEVDVNVHPAKAEVRFRDRSAVERLVEEGVRVALGGLASAANIGSPPGDSAAYPPHGPRHSVVREPAPPPPVGEPQMSLFVSRVISTSSPIDAASEPLEVAPTPMWQLHNTYIIAETRTGIVLVDQHSAHERVLYEQLMRDFDRGAAATQRLLFPLTLRLSATECATVEELRGVLERAGWEAEPFGGDHVIVHAAPQPHAGFDAERCLREMIGELTSGSALVDPARTQHQRVALSYACKAAIKAGQPLSRAEMTELFDRLFATDLPYHDIHGRPTVVQLSLAELHRRFGRSG